MTTTPDAVYKKGIKYPVVKGVDLSKWWLSGGISASNCVAVYQPKGAVSYTASKTNLANPGTYDATEGSAPDWDATNGWKFSTGNSNYLSTNIIPSSGWSAIVRFSNFQKSNNNALFGSESNAGPYDRFFIYPNFGDGKRYYGNGGYIGITGAYSFGIMAIAAGSGYLNGSFDVSIPNSWNGVGNIIYIGSWHNNSTQVFASGYIQAFAIYNTTITASQVSALTTAMNAL